MESAPISGQIDRAAEYLRVRENFGETDVCTVISPCPITPLGSYLESQGGAVLGMNSDARTLLAFIPNREGKVRLYSMDRPGVVEFALEHIKPPARDDWGRHAVRAAKALQGRSDIDKGFTGVLSAGRGPFGPGKGASESLACLSALAHVNGVELAPGDLVELESDIARENRRTPGGLADTASIVYGVKNTILYIDTNTGRAVSYPAGAGGEDFGIMTVSSGTPPDTMAALLTTRDEECRKAAGFLGIMGGLRSAKSLAYVPEKVFLEKSLKLPDELRLRAVHFYSEAGRVAAGVSAWKSGDMKRFGDLMNESCESSIVNYGIGGPELISLKNIVSETPGVYGCVSSDGVSLTALVSRDFPPESPQGILDRFTREHPGLKGGAAVCFARTDGGLRVV